MMLDKERRRYERFEHKTPINLYRIDCQDQYYHSEMIDYCKGGLSLVTNQKLVINHLVYLEMKNHNQNSTGPEKHKGFYGTIKWVAPAPSSKDTTLYRYGVECGIEDDHSVPPVHPPRQKPFF